jgi:cell division protein FtsN
VQTEPQRLARQIKPDAVQLRKPEAAMPDSAASAPSASASGPAGECLEAGPFDEAQSVALRRAASAVLPASAWTVVPTLTPARWIVYIGQYSSPATIENKRAELAALKISVEPLTNPELELGLSLGHFETRAAAAAALEALKKRGLRKALVVQEQPELPGLVLQVRLSNGLARAQLSGLTPALAGKDWVPCR